MANKTQKSVLIIVAHPDDEMLWAGGTILDNPLWECFIISLCRKDDKDRAPKFYSILKALKAKGIMGNLDDEPEQTPLNNTDIQQIILDLLPKPDFDLIITHKAHIYNMLPKSIWLKKYNLITEVYGFKKDSWEAQTTPKAEAF